MNYLNEHRAKLKKRLPIAMSGVQKGMVLTCRYTNKEGQSKDNMLLVLNPSYNGKLHALSLNKFSSGKFNSLAKSVGLVDIQKYAVRGIDIPKLSMDQSSNRFYGSFLGNVKTEFNDSYRTYFLSKIGGLTLVDYNFNDSINRR
tara:strand:- start:104 stop:535 length:432 start_codon:yes stop_codon:yes gene_type:complete